MLHQPGDVIYERYEIIKIIGGGGFGKTYLAYDIEPPQRTCLLKHLQPSVVSNQLLLKIAEDKFRQEAGILRRLGSNYQQIPELYNYFQDRQEFYLVQEYIDGRNLEEELQVHHFNETEIIEILYDVLHILNYLYQNNVIHRDIKPANLIRRSSDRKIFLVDFGAVKEVTNLSINAQGQATTTMVIGTPMYMSPEQKEGKPEFGSDIYSLGLTILKLLTRINPLQKSYTRENICNGLQINPVLAKVLEKMLCYNHQERYQKPAEASADLEPLIILGQTLSQRYKIKSYLGGVGFCYTYLAEDLQRPYQPDCILKKFRLRNNNPQMWSALQSYLATAAKKIEELPRHPQIPRLLNHFQTTNEFYLVNEFIEGSAVAESLKADASWGEAEVIALLKDVLESLSHIHQQGIIHGDIKPSNLIRRQQDGKICIIDFADFKPTITLNIHSQSIIVKSGGTDGYIETEQDQNQPRTCSDIYALGITAIQILTGIAPNQLQKDSRGEVVWQNRVKVSPKLARILTKMVRVESKKRYQSATKVLEDLHRSRRHNSIKHLPVLGIAGIVSIGLIFFLFAEFRRYQAESFYNDGVDKANKGDFQGAIAAYDEAVKLDPNFTEALVNQGYVYGKLKNFTRQFNVCTTAAKINSNSSRAILCQGNAQYLSKQYQESIVYFEQVINLSCQPQGDIGVCTDALNNKGESLLQLKQVDLAIAEFDKAIEKDQNNYIAWTNKGKALLQKQALREALQAFEKALTIKNDYKDAMEGIKEVRKRLSKKVISN